MKDHLGKIVFVVGVIFVALISRAFYPKIYTAANGTATSSSSSNGVPAFVMPSLSASVVQNVAPGGDLASGETPTAPTPAGADNSSVSSPAVPVAPVSTAIVVSMGPVANSSFARVGGATPPMIDDQVSLIADLTTGAPFLQWNATKRWPMASITKLMTATIVLDKLSLTQEVTVTADAFAADPSEKLLRVGDVYTVADLLRVMLLPSSNVAAETLADAYGRDAFVAEMNVRAAQWGMTNTHYDDPSGLSVADQSTATDLLALAQKVYTNYPQIFAITRTPQVTVTELSSGIRAVVKGINSFAGETNFVGGKTGYTDQASGNLLSVFFYNNHPVFVLILGTNDNDRFANTEKLYDWFTKNFK